MFQQITIFMRRSKTFQRLDNRLGHAVRNVLRITNAAVDELVTIVALPNQAALCTVYRRFGRISSSIYSNLLNKIIIPLKRDCACYHL